MFPQTGVSFTSAQESPSSPHSRSKRCRVKLVCTVSQAGEHGSGPWAGWGGGAQDAMGDLGDLVCRARHPSPLRHLPMAWRVRAVSTEGWPESTSPRAHPSDFSMGTSSRRLQQGLGLSLCGDPTRMGWWKNYLLPPPQPLLTSGAELAPRCLSRRRSFVSCAGKAGTDILGPFLCFL